MTSKGLIADVHLKFYLDKRENVEVTATQTFDQFSRLI